MIIISPITYSEENGKARIETVLKCDKRKDFTLFVETDLEYGKYLVTDRADAFLIGILNYAMTNGHDIKCEIPVSSELKFLLEKQLIFELSKYDPYYYATKIFADVTYEAIQNEGAVGTGISLGLDSFCTIAEMYKSKYKDMALTHLMTFNNGVVGGSYMNNNWNFCASKLHERIENVADELNLPLINVNTNLALYMHPRVDYYITYNIIMLVLSLGKLFSKYFISSNGDDFSYFNIKNTAFHDAGVYEFLTIYCCSIKNSVQFLSGGGEKDRVEKMRTIADFPIAKKNLQSCLTEHYNCMNCQKCKRNLITLDALGFLDDFAEVYDVNYYRKNRAKYIEWMCQQIMLNNHASDYIRPAYEMIKEREPALIEKYEMSLEKLISTRTELQRQRDVFREYTLMFRRFIQKPNSIEKLKKWFEDKKIKNIIIYGFSEGTQLLISIKGQLNINIDYIVQNVRGNEEHEIPRLPESTIDYPNTDAVIISNVDKPEVLKRKLSYFVDVPVYTISDVMKMSD